MMFSNWLLSETGFPPISGFHIWIDLIDLINLSCEIPLNSTLYKQFWLEMISELLPDTGRDKKADVAFLEKHRKVLPQVIITGSKPFVLE
jgi:hypothetical protein